MAVTTIPNVTSWSVTPQNGQVGYFTLMNTWLSESTAVIASLQDAIDAQNLANEEINDLAIQVENNAIVATSLANYQGVWSDLVTYSKSMSVSVGSLYYISKVDNNLNHVVTDANYWLYNPINDKLDKDFSVLEDKTTPTDSDIFATRETGGLLKKLSWANLKATLKTYFDTLYLALAGNQSVDGVKTFTSSPIVPTPTAQDNSTKVATTAYVDGKMVLGTAVNSTSGTSIDFTGIPSWVKKITVLFNGVSTNGASPIQIQIGSGSVQNTGYTGSNTITINAAVGASGFTTGFGVTVSVGNSSASNSLGGICTISNLLSSTYSAFGGFGTSIGAVYTTAGSVTLSGILDRIRITTVNGTDTFDAGQINIMYEG